jgi:hypothetical protein
MSGIVIDGVVIPLDRLQAMQGIVVAVNLDNVEFLPVQAPETGNPTDDDVWFAPLDTADLAASVAKQQARGLTLIRLNIRAANKRQRLLLGIYWVAPYSSIKFRGQSVDNGLRPVEALLAHN